MRPKKEILLVDANELSNSLRTFFLLTRGFSVHRSVDNESAIEQLLEHPDTALMVIEANGVRFDELIRMGKRVQPEIKTLLLSGVIEAGQMAHQADLFLGKGKCDSFTLLEAAKVLTSRKHGPKKTVVMDLASKRRWA